MSNRVFRSRPYGSGLALAAMMVALMSFHGQPSVRNDAASAPGTTAPGIVQAPQTRSSVAPGMVKADFVFDIISNIYRNPVGH